MDFWCTQTSVLMARAKRPEAASRAEVCETFIAGSIPAVASPPSLQSRTFSVRFIRKSRGSLDLCAAPNAPNRDGSGQKLYGPLARTLIPAFALVVAIL